jgi:hypothetical protein
MSLFLKIEDASTLLLMEPISTGDRVSTREHYLAWHALQLERRGLARVWMADVGLVAYINHGRWTTDCPTCSRAHAPQGMWTHPDWRIACCTECGAVYRHVAFPPHVDAMAAALLNRPRDLQNWRSPETLDDLLAENVAHGVAS